ncbi:MAG: polyphosphate polymerase domain-containing protein [Bacteroidales bacterium]|jgi:hypothetical protein
MAPDLHISEILSSFPAITLPELDSYMLMNRVDTKYVFSASRIPGILKDLDGRYRTLEIDSLRVFPYHTTYFDSEDWMFFRQHVKRRGVRSKVRFRKYEQTGTQFLEVKRRTNKLRTEKWRILKEINSAGGFDEESLNFIMRHVARDTPHLKPVVVNRFKRITLTSETSEERVTIDFDLIFSDPEGNSFSVPAIGVIERKRIDFSNRSPLAETLKKNFIYPTGFSKYCLGTAVLYDLPGKSLIKPKLLLINKISNENPRQYHAGQHFN